MTTYIVVLVGARVGTEQEAFDRVRTAAGDADEIQVVLGLVQDFEGDARTSKVRLTDAQTLDDELLFAEIDSRVMQARSLGESVVVSSFLGRIGTHLNSKFGADDDVRYKALTPSPPLALKLKEWPEAELPSADAARLVVGAVLSQPDHAIDQTNLRLVLAALDPRFDKGAGIPIARSVGFIQAVVKQAATRGWVHVEGEGPNPRISITAAGRAIYPAPAPRPTMPIAPRDSAGLVSSRVEESAKPKEDLAQTWIELLRRDKFGPFMQVRSLFVEELAGQVVKHPGAFTANRITSRALRQVEGAYKAPLKRDGSGTQAGIRWQDFAAFAIRLLTEAPVLLDEDSHLLIPLYGGSALPKVHAIDADFKYTLDAAIVLRLLSIGARVNILDVSPLTTVLYNDQKSVENRLRTDELLIEMIDRGDLNIDPHNGTLTVSSSSGDGSVPEVVAKAEEPASHDLQPGGGA